MTTTFQPAEFELVHERNKGFTRVPLSPPPFLKSDDVLIRPRWVGICGSDLYLIAVHDGPLRLGHEWIGVVEKVGPSTSDLKPGDLVTSTGTVACFECGFCEDEKTNFCDSAVYFSSDKMGALRSWFVLGEKQLIRVEGELRKEQALHELIAVAEAAVDLIDANSPDPRERDLLVLGAGPVGMLLALVAKDRGYVPLIVDKIGFRVELARKVGLNAVPFARALLDPTFRQRFKLITDTTHDYSKDSGAFRFVTTFAKKEFSVLMVGKYKAAQEIPPAFNSMGGKLTWMRGVPHTTLARSIAKWGPRLDELAGGFITHCFDPADTNAAFVTATEKTSSMKVLIELPEMPHVRSR